MRKSLENSLLEFYKKSINSGNPTIYKLPQAGSNRSYFRITAEGGRSLIAVDGDDLKENKAFVEISKVFNVQGVNSPKVVAFSANRRYYIQSDLGDVSLFQMILADGGDVSAETKNLLVKTIKALADIQFRVGRNLDFSVCYPKRKFDLETINFDLNYFKYCFLKPVLLDFDEVSLQRDFRRLTKKIQANFIPNVFTYRDFQSRNVMIKDGEPYFIDFQGGREGFLHYDLASFLWQAKANFSDELRTELIEVYLDSATKYMPDIDRAKFRAELQYFVLFRLLQVLGAYGFRGLVEGKKHFIESIPLALDSVKSLSVLDEFKHIKKLFQSKRFEQFHQAPQSFERLTVQVESFSYKKGGIPQDRSDNGGGYVFDCRGIHNPGRYAEYKTLTGKDKPVQEFLLEKSDVQEFLQDVYSLIDRHLEVYQRRGFTHLCIFFGCTGGQHRSVFCAEQTAKYLKKYDINIELRHNELQ